MSDGDFVSLLRIIGKKLRQQVVEVDLAILDQKQNRGCGELLRDRPDAVNRVGRSWNVQFDVGESESSGTQDHVTFGNSNTQSNHFFCLNSELPD